MAAPIVAFIGRSESGKTTYIEKLLPELKRRGYRIATVKHVPQHFRNTPSRDTERHFAAGADATIAVTPDALILTKPVAAETHFDEIGRLLGDEYDLIIAEGFKGTGVPKIEVWRKEIGEPLEGIKSKVAVVTDDQSPSDALRKFSRNDISSMADFLEKSYIKPQCERLSLHVNGNPLTLSAFPKEFVGKVVDAMIASLKGVPKVNWLEISSKKVNDKST
jgi:molybdopterin-guanine dinucleotide biosynthesis protein B